MVNVETGDHRRSFVQSKGDFFKADSHNELMSLHATVKGKVNSAIATAMNADHCKEHAMPKVCQGMDYCPPVIASHAKGPKHENCFQISNDAHSKSTNNGFSRVKENGAFYCH